MAALGAAVWLVTASALGAPRLDIHPWTDALAPPVYAPGDSIARRTYGPDSLGASDRERVVAAFAASPPRIDGDLDDWRLVRWSDLAGALAVTRGQWTGPQDLRVRFALAWTPEGIFFAARLWDDIPSTTAGPVRPPERVTLAIASEDRVVQRYWIGPSRRFRVARDGRLDAWTDLRRRRPEPFDAVAVGARAAVRVERDSSGAPSPAGFELFVPWTALFPLVPAPRARALVNVILEDIDGASEKVAAWSTRQVGGTPRAAWAELEFARGGSVPAWIVSISTRHPEPWCEWSLAAWGQTPSQGRVELRATGLPDSRAESRASLPSGDRFLLRFGPIGPARSVWPSERGARVEVLLPGEQRARAWDLLRPFDPDSLRATIGSMQASIAPDAPATFPTMTDAVVRLETARRQIESMGTWTENRFQGSGILVWRAGALARIESVLEEAEAVRSSLRAAATGSTPATLPARLWPRRGLGGLPAGEPFLRGHRSRVDGSVQPYVVFVPDTTGPRPPLLVVLHDIDQDESTLLAKTTLVERCRARGWIVLSPLGRGNVGYLATGERDVVEAIEAVRGSLPIDGRRIYLIGLGMGGTGAWLLPLRHPDLFAGAAIVAGYGDFGQPGLFEAQGFRAGEEPWYEAHDPARLVRRDMTTVFRIVHGERDAVVSPVHARVLHARLDELGVKHEFRLDPTGDHSLGFFEDELVANLDFLGRQARATDGQWNRGAYATAGPPVADVFARGPFVIVWGTSGSASGPEDGSADPAGSDVATPAARPDDLATAQQLAAQWSAQFHGTARVLPDTSVTAELLRTTNLVLVGDPSTNALLARWAGRLPIHTEPGIFNVGSSGYPLAKYGIIYATLNPDYPDRSLVVVSGMQDRLDALPRSAFGVAAAYAVVSRTQGMILAGDFVE